jgi:small multidrug resistance family-3 protein
MAGDYRPARDTRILRISTLRVTAARQPEKSMVIVKTLGLFVLTALAEILGCYLPYLWLKKQGSVWLLVPAACSLALFAWLLSLHPTAAGRVYAAYGGVYISVAILWLWLVDSVRPTVWDVLGMAVALLGMAIIMFSPHRT